MQLRVGYVLLYVLQQLSIEDLDANNEASLKYCLRISNIGFPAKRFPVFGIPYSIDFEQDDSPSSKNTDLCSVLQ